MVEHDKRNRRVPPLRGVIALSPGYALWEVFLPIAILLSDAIIRTVSDIFLWRAVNPLFTMTYGNCAIRS